MLSLSFYKKVLLQLNCRKQTQAHVIQSSDKYLSKICSMLKWAQEFLSYYQKQLRQFGLIQKDISQVAKIRTKKKKYIQKRKKILRRNRLQIVRDYKPISQSIFSPQIDQIKEVNINPTSLNEQIFDSVKQESTFQDCQINPSNDQIQSNQILPKKPEKQQKIGQDQSLNAIYDVLEQIPIGLILYEKQFNELSYIINQSITSLRQSDKRRIFRNIVLVGPRHSGKKHLINQVLKKLHNENNIRKQSQNILKIQKIFVSQQTSAQNLRHSNLIQEQLLEKQDNFKNIFQRVQEKNPYIFASQSEINQKSYLQIKQKPLVTLIVRVVDATVYISLISQDKFYNKQDANLVVINILSLAQSEIPQIFSKPQNKIQQQQVLLPLHQETDIFMCTRQSLHQNKGSPLFKSYHAIIFLALPQNSKLEYLLKEQLFELEGRLKKYYSNQENQSFTVKMNYNESVIKFAIRYLTKKYQQNKETPSPLICIKYMMNFLLNYWRKDIISYKNNLDTTNFHQMNDKYCQSHNPTYDRVNRNPQNLCEDTKPSFHAFQIVFQLNSSLIINFFSSLIQDSDRKQFSLNSLILCHQVILISCFSYSTHPQFQNDLFIDAIKLFPFFQHNSTLIGSQFLTEQHFWNGLEKLKEMGLIIFKSDEKHKNQAPKKSFKKVVKVKNYLNRSFRMTFSLNKIKDQFENVEIFKKFFHHQH